MENYTFSDNSSDSSRRNSERRRVSFPETELVTYAEPTNPLKLAQNVTVEQIRTAYLLNCIKYKTNPLRNVLDQIMRLELGTMRESSFEIRGEIITSDMCETFEEIFRRVQFCEFNLINCMISDDAAAALFDMIEYYETATRFRMNISFGIESRGWDSFKRYLSKSQCLQCLELFNMDIKENEFALLVSPLSSNTHLEIFKIRNCTLQSSIAMSSLALRLQQNSTLRELYLPHNGLTPEDAEILSNIVRNNHSLYLLDLSNNTICDRGAGYIFSALCEKNSQDRLLNVLILWNTNLTDNFAEPFKKFLKENYKLEILNLGQNKIKDEGFLSFEADLKENKSLVRLGVQKCELTDSSVKSAGRIILDNNSLERIDFRGNDITLDGLKNFFHCLENSTTVLQADFDPLPSDNAGVPVYSALLSSITQRCDANQILKKNDQANAEDSKRKKASRKISLTCQTLTTQRRSPPISTLRTSSGRLRSPDLSPVPSPSASPKPSVTKSRFHITLVNETKPKASRFTVFNVKESTVRTTVGFDIPTTSAEMSNNGVRTTIGFDIPTTSADTLPNNGMRNPVTFEVPTTSADPLSNNGVRFEVPSGEPANNGFHKAESPKDGFKGFESAVMDAVEDKENVDDQLFSGIETSVLACELAEPLELTTLSDSSRVETGTITAKDDERERESESEEVAEEPLSERDSKQVNNKSAFIGYVESDLTDIGTINSEFYVIAVSGNSMKANENVIDCVENKLEHLRGESVDLKNNNQLEVNPTN